MAKQRLVNCDFMNNMTKVSNKAKLLYLSLFTNADDHGFVGNGEEIVNALNKNDLEHGVVSLELLENDYVAAMNELIESGLVIGFVDNHCNKIFLIKHWYYHNKYKKGLWTNYYKLLKKVEIVDSEYVLKKSSTKENNKLNHDKLNQIKLNQDKIKIEQNKDEQNETIELNEDDYPFEL